MKYELSIDKFTISWYYSVRKTLDCPLLQQEETRTMVYRICFCWCVWFMILIEGLHLYAFLFFLNCFCWEAYIRGAKKDGKGSLLSFLLAVGTSIWFIAFHANTDTFRAAVLHMLLMAMWLGVSIFITDHKRSYVTQK